jgi:hypothetical protein
MSTSLLIQTHSIANVHKQIADKVAYLIQITNDETKAQTSYASLAKPAETVNAAVKSLTATANKLMESNDEILQREMALGIKVALEATRILLQAVKEMKETQQDWPPNCQKLHQAAKLILNGVTKILVIWDESEVRKIICLAQSSQDRLKLIQGALSMRALVVCYHGFYESTMQLIPLVSERQQDMIDDSKKDVIQNSLDAVKKALQPFSQAMIDFVKEPEIKEKQDIKNQLAIEISSAIGRIIETLSPSSEETNTQQAVGAAPIEETQPLALKAAEHSDDDDIIDDDDSDDESIFTITNTTSTDSITIANQMNMVKHQLLKSKECHIKPELDKYISAIIKNSKSVAEESKSHFKEKILQLCDEVLILRQKLTTCYEEYNDNPDSEEKKSAFHDAVDQLCSKLEELDVVVAESVAHQIAETFVSPSAAIDTFVDKVSSSQVDDEVSNHYQMSCIF